MSIRQIIISGFLLIYATGCTDSHVIDISTIATKPTKYLGKKVTISGTVSYAAGIGGYGTYTVTDKTGSIVIITSLGIPKSKTTLDKITGVVHQPISFGNNSVLLIIQGDISIQDIMNLLRDNKANVGTNKTYHFNFNPLNAQTTNNCPRRCPMT